jgi:hypothetical protein
MRNDDRAEAGAEEGSGNVFADLGLEDSEGLYARAKLGFHVYQILKRENSSSEKSPPFSASSRRKCPTS